MKEIGYEAQSAYVDALAAEMEKHTTLPWNFIRKILMKSLGTSWVILPRRLITDGRGSEVDQLFEQMLGAKQIISEEEWARENGINPGTIFKEKAK